MIPAPSLAPSPGFSLASFRRLALTALAALALSGPALEAATVTTNETALDGIFSQTSFGTSPIDIRFNALVTLLRPASFLDVDTAAELNDLLTYANGYSPTLGIVFADSISYCGSPGTNIVGCGNVGSSGVVVDSGYAAGSYGAELLAHEMGHNLGLSHTAANSGNLMDPTLNHDTTLTSDQVTTILGSSLVQTDSKTHGRFIQVQPILLAAVPLPAGGLLLLGGIGALVTLRRRQARRLMPGRVAA